MMPLAEKTRGLTPVHLLTGFLGSGKTTLLQRMLTDPALSDAAVLINEFGEVGLDHELLGRIDDAVVLMRSGCLCCTVRGEIADSLLDLHSRRERGEIPWFDQVVIETTGLADPFPVLSTIRAHPVLRSHFAIGRVVTTVDAVNAFGQLDRRDEAVRQIGAADVIVLTKTDLPAASDVPALRGRLARLNPLATVVDGAEAAIAALVATVSGRWLGDDLDAASPDAGDDGDHHHQYHHDHHRHAHGSGHDHIPQGDDAPLGVTTFSIVTEDPMDWTAFGIWMTMLLNRHGDHIFRVKGILNLAGEDRPVAVHGVQRLVHPPVHLDAWPTADRSSRLVFILEGLNPDRIAESLAVFNRLSNPRAAVGGDASAPAPETRVARPA